MPRSVRWRRGARWAVSLAIASSAAGCNQVLGINEPLDDEWDGGGAAPIGASNENDGTVSRPGSDASTDSDGADGSSEPAHSYADWPMPNPPSTGLPNPQSYDALSVPGVVLDKVTSLAWQRGVDAGLYDWTEALSYCAGLSVAGGRWRLPSRIELVSIIDFTQGSPAIDRMAFPDTPGEQFWTASPLAGDRTSAWSVYFGFGTGFGYASTVSNTYHVRCVR